MKAKHNPTPWKFLETYKGKYYNAEWPSLPEMFDINVERFPENKCWECFNPTHILFTYKEAKAMQKKVASYLVSLGVKKGDRVGVTGLNSPEWALAYMSIVTMGAIVAPVDYSLTDEEIESLLDFAEVKGLFVDGERFDRIGKGGKYGFKVSLTPKGFEDQYILNVPETNEKYEQPVCDDLAAFLFTSGTTGNPKTVMLTHKNLVSDAWQAQGLMNIYPTDVFYAILPIQHAYTMLAVMIEGMCSGANVVFGKRLVIKQLFKEMKEGQVTMFLAVPLLYNKLISAMMKGVAEKGKLVAGLIHAMMGFSGWMKKTFNVNIGKKMFGFLLKKVSLENVRICISGGGPLPASTFKQFNQLGLDFVQGYGLTETSPILTLNPIFDYEEASIGKVVPGVEMKFVDKDENGNGEICVKGSMVMQGYYNNEEATKEIIDEDGFLHTGDIGYMDDRGFVYLTGRAKNIIVTEGGKNVFPEEIEDHFQLYYDADQVCVTGYTLDAKMKTEGIAVLIYPSDEYRKAGHSKEEMQKHFDGIVEEINKELLPYKRMRKVILIDEPMEMSSTKKIKRFIVAKKYKAQING
ncbi:MAG: AMP-binding protein [Sphaerochaetaceae bacterium]|nr:AMP-binding protein [Sphaerochaetaceae bacterium]